MLRCVSVWFGVFGGFWAGPGEVSGVSPTFGRVLVHFGSSGLQVGLGEAFPSVLRGALAFWARFGSFRQSDLRRRCILVYFHIFSCTFLYFSVKGQTNGPGVWVRKTIPRTKPALSDTKNDTLKIRPAHLPQRTRPRTQTTAHTRRAPQYPPRATPATGVPFGHDSLLFPLAGHRAAAPPPLQRACRWSL